MTAQRLSVLAACAALAVAGPVSAQTGGRPAPRQGQVVTPAVNPALATPTNMPKLATDPTLLLAQINELKAQMSSLQQQVEMLKQQNAAQEARIDSQQAEAAAFQAAYATHKHQLVKIGTKMMTTLSCTYAGGYPSCKPDPYPGGGLVTAAAGGDDWKQTSGPVP